MPVNKTCIQCHTNYTLTPSKAEASLYCSRKCSSLSQKQLVQLQCLQCTKDFQCKPNQATKRRFCSTSCHKKFKLPKLKDKKFTYLTVTSFFCGEWICVCDCGKQTTATSSELLKGQKKSCGCYARLATSERQRIELFGKRFGRLQVISLSGSDKRNGTIWLCKCDCGNEKEILATRLIKNITKSCGCISKERKGENHESWRGGKYTCKQGYVYIKSYDHPNRKGNGYILEHRLVMEKQIGRLLLPNENVHHKNGIRNDNRIENLELWVKPQTTGQRAEDLVAFAREIIQTYGKLFPM